MKRSMDAMDTSVTAERAGASARKSPRRSIAAIGLALALLTFVATAARAQSPTPGWVPTLPVTFGLDTHLSAFPDGSAFAFDDGWDYVYVSSDHGLTWSPTEIPATRGGAVFEMQSPEIGYFKSSGGFFRTTDSTRSWKRIADLPLPGPNFFDRLKTGNGWGYGITAMDASRDGALMVLGGDVHYFEDYSADCLGPKARAAVWTKRTGKRWHRTEFPHPGKVRDLSFLNENVGIALVLRWGPSAGSDQFTCESKQTIIYRTTDGGRTFRKVAARSFDPSEPAAFTSIGIASRNTFVAGAADGSMVRTTDGGRTFRSGPALVNPVTNPVTSTTSTPLDNAFWVTGLDFPSASVGYASTKGGGTWRTVDAGRTWVLEPSNELVFSRRGFGDIAAADVDHAISAGGTSILSRVP